MDLPVGPGHHAVSDEGLVLVPTFAGTLKAIGASGTESWSYAGPGPLYAASVAADGTVYVGSESGQLLAVTKTGQLLWSYTAGGAVRSRPTIDGAQNLYFCAGSSVYSVDAQPFLREATRVLETKP